MVGTVRRPRVGRCQRGFTLLELMIVVGIIAILASLAAPYYRGAKRKAQEAVLREDLWILRDVIDQYYADKGQYPASLEELVTVGYIRKVPVDPMTGSNGTWELIEVNQGVDDSFDEEEISAGGVYDVRSGSPGQALDGSYFSDW